MDDRTCSDDACDRPPRARGLCNVHYQRAKRAGTLPELPEVPGAPAPKHTLSNIDAAARTADCLECGPQVRIRVRERGRGRYECRRRSNGTPAVRAARRRRNKIRRKYRIAYEEYVILVEAQDGRCMLCQERPDRPLVVDHCHTTGTVRGLLCGPCNFGLGFFRDNPEVLARAARYVRKYNRRAPRQATQPSRFTASANAASDTRV